MDNKNYYFEEERSIGSKTRDIPHILKTVANRFMGDNPQKPLMLRAFPKDNFLQEFGGRFIFDFDKRYPDAEVGDYIYAYAHTFLDEAWDSMLSFRAKSPAWVYLNGELIVSTSWEDEIPFSPRGVHVKYKKGINTFFIKLRKNVLDFGCEFGHTFAQYGMMIYLNPFGEQSGVRGWAYTKPQKEDIFPTPDTFPKVGDSQGTLWLPKPSETHYSIDEVLGTRAGVAYGMTELINDSLEKEYTFEGKSDVPCRIYIDGISRFEGTGMIKLGLRLSNGVHRICVELVADEGRRTGFCLNTEAELTASGIVRGTKAHWLWLGKLSKPDDTILTDTNLIRLYGADDGGLYWQTDCGDDVRISSEVVNAGWIYPLGVVFYGLITAARELGDSHIGDYAENHMKMLADSYEYALWDTKRYGRSAMHYQMQMLTMLDFCGSCGNAIMEVTGYNDPGVRMIADAIAEFIKNDLERFDDGTLYRKGPPYQQNTIWADDTYMSIPFMCRYYEQSGDKTLLDDAVVQTRGFYKYLFSEESGLMSHIYTANYDKKNEIPWGRGDGWVLFALTELLRVMPVDYDGRDFVLSFYRKLCEGVIKCQDKDGMWHQVLDEPDSYPETSCTAMFVCAFSRGINNGWLEDERFVTSAIKGWRALCTYSIDNLGNLYGVCASSCLSYCREYYIDELGWNFNDTHGTGIALIAGVEVLRMQNKIK